MKWYEIVGMTVVTVLMLVATYEVNETAKRQPKQPPIVVYLVTPQQAAQIESGALPEYGVGRVRR